MAARTKPELTQLERLAAEFEPGEHKNRKQGGTELTYIGIDATITRLNAVLGAGWSTDATTEVTTVPIFEEDENGVSRQTGVKYLAVCELTLTANIDGTDKHAVGVGADTDGRDPDKAAKTALAEAIKKAGHQLGIGLYLWDEDARKRVNKKMKLADGSIATLKQEVVKIARERLAKEKPSAKDIAGLFGVSPTDLAEEETLRGILTKEGLL